MKLVIYQPGEPDLIIDTPDGTTVVVNDQIAAVDKFHVRLVPPVTSKRVLLEGFRGDLGWVHDREGHSGRPYWPGGFSGLTLDPGFDLGQKSRADLDRYYGKIIDGEARKRLYRWVGVRGHEAQSAPKDPGISGIRISRDDAAALMPLIALPYWEQIARRFPVLQAPATPPGVQTVLLSLAFNRGAKNPDLLQLKTPLERGDWARVGEMVSQMQRTHSLEGIRVRRQLEGRLILESLA